MRASVAWYNLTSRHMIIAYRSVGSKRGFHMELVNVGHYRVLVLRVGPVMFEFIRRC